MPVLLNRSRLENAARVAEEAVAHGPQPTALIAVADRRETIWTHVVPGEDEARLDSIYPLGSITKPIVATAIMRLVEEGRLALNVPVAQYLPEFGGNGRESITTWHILTHSSGLEEGQFNSELYAIGARGEEPPPGWLFEANCRSWPRFVPGTEYEYNSLTFAVLGELITRLAGEPYPEYLCRNIFEPLGMASTGFEPVDPARALPVHGFDPPGAIGAWNRMSVPGGGLYSTAADLVAFGQAYLRGGEYGGYHLLSPASIEVMTQHHTAGGRQFGTGDRFNYGLGWGKPSLPHDGDVPASERAYGHAGITGTLLWIDPAYDLVFVFLSNRWGIVDPSEASMRALNAVYGAVEPGA
jgi:CubicO group peptidase (beta-lactamase class C family)